MRKREFIGLLLGCYFAVLTQYRDAIVTRHKTVKVALFENKRATKHLLAYRDCAGNRNNPKENEKQPTSKVLKVVSLLNHTLARYVS